MLVFVLLRFLNFLRLSLISFIFKLLNFCSLYSFDKRTFPDKKKKVRMQQNLYFLYKKLNEINFSKKN